MADGMTSLPEWPDEMDPGEEISAKLWRWLAPFIFTLGVVGNSLILIVLQRSGNSGTGTHVFVKFLAAADLSVMVCAMLPEWLRAQGLVNLREAHPATCTCYKFFMYTSADIAIWLITGFTVERFVAVCMPLRKQHFCRITQVKIYCVMLAVLAIAKNLHAFFTRGKEWAYKNTNNTDYVQDDYDNPFTETSYIYNSSDHDTVADKELYLVSNCGYTSPANAHFHYYIRPWIVFAVSNVIPLVILIICNSAVIITLYRRRTSRYLSNNGNQGDDTMNQVTVMCLVVSIAFVLFYMPSMILLVGKPYWQESPQHRNGYLIAKAVANQLLFINHSCNFYLYVITGDRFRQLTFQTIKCCRENKEYVKYRNSQKGSQRKSNLDSNDKNVKLITYKQSS